MPTAARRATFPELLGHPDVIEGSVMRSTFGLMAFHGGLEAGTGEIAEAAAEATGASLYFVNQPKSLRWHVPSRTIDPDHSPLLAQWLSHVDVAVALHGYGRIGRPRRILLGGSNRHLAAQLAVHLRQRLSGIDAVTDLEDMPAELRGLHPANPVNRPRFGGVQVELPPSARGTSLLPPDPAWGPGGSRALVIDALIALIREYADSDATAG